MATLILPRDINFKNNINAAVATFGGQKIAEVFSGTAALGRRWGIKPIVLFYYWNSTSSNQIAVSHHTHSTLLRVNFAHTTLTERRGQHPL